MKSKVHTLLRVSVPCQFGNGFHPLTTTFDNEGALLGVRCGCENLPKEIEEVAAALAEDDHRSCRQVRKMVTDFCRGHQQQNFSTYAARMALNEKTGTSALSHVLQIAQSVSEERARNNEKKLRSTEEEYLMSEAEPRRRRCEILARQIRFYLKDVHVEVNLQNFRGSPRITVHLGSYIRHVRVIYFGNGIWSVPKSFGDLEVAPVDGKCPICGTSHSRKHAESAKHAEQAERKVLNMLARISPLLARAEFPDHG